MANGRIDGATVLARKTAKSATFIISGKILSALIQALMFIVIARLLAPQGYGIYTLILSVVAFISAFGSLSIGTYLNERVPFLMSKRRSGEIKVAFGDTIVAVLIPGIALFVIGSMLSVPISGYVLHSTAYAPLLVLALSSIIFSLLYNTFSLVLVSFNDGKGNAMGMVIYSAVQAAVAIVLVASGAGIAGAIIGYTSALFLSFLFEFMVARRRFGITFVRKNMYSRIRSMLRFSMPLTYSGITSTVVTNFSVILLGLFVVPSLVGQYGVASRVGTVMDVFAGSISVVLLPTFAEAIYNKGIGKKVGRFFYYSIFFGFLFTTPMIAYVVVYANYLITTLFTPAYSQAVLYMQLISVGLLIGTFGSYAGQLIISMRKTPKYFKYTLIAGIAEAVSLLVLVPKFHVIGLIISMLYVGGITTNVLLMNQIRKEGISIRMGKIWRVMVSNVVLAAILYAILRIFPLFNREAMIVAGIALTFVLYPPIVVKTGALTKDDISLLRKIAEGTSIAGTALAHLLSYASFFA